MFCKIKIEKCDLFKQSALNQCCLDQGMTKQDSGLTQCYV